MGQKNCRIDCKPVSGPHCLLSVREDEGISADDIKKLMKSNVVLIVLVFDGQAGNSL